jgi:hypothetical protein
VQETGRLPEGLAVMPPGPELGVLLAGLDLARVRNDQVVDVLQAQARQLAREQARMFAALVEVGRATPLSDPTDHEGHRLLGAQRLGAVHACAAGEIAAALTWTAAAADRELALAEVVVTHLPLVFAALEAGLIDRPKAIVFADQLDPAVTELTREQVAGICGALVPVAPGLTTGRLRARLVRMLFEVDPAHARRRYVRSVRERAVIGYLHRDGTVTVSATGLPPHEAAAACDRLELLARAVKRAGHPGRSAQIQADLFLGMLDGRFHRMTEAQIITALLADRRLEDGAEPPARPTAGRAAAGHAADVSAATGPCGAANDDGAGPAGDHPPHTGIEIRAGLATVMGLDDRCGEIPGLGPVLAEVARTVVTAQHRGAQWRFAVTDADGFLLLAGVTRRRPVVAGAPAAPCRGGVVELHVPATVLERLAADTRICGPWAAVVADIAAQFDRRDELRARLDARPHDRFARAALARYVEVRDRTCSHPGCRRPARSSDKDHTREHARGGSTTRHNIGPGCDRHHMYRHEGGWCLSQPEPGHFVWTSPLGRVYRTRGEPISAPAVPVGPGPEDPEQSPAEVAEAGPILVPPTPAHRDDPPPRAPPTDHDDLPPH